MPIRKIVISILVAVLAVAVLAFIFLSRPVSRTVDTPLMREYSRIHQICTKLRYYADEHSTLPDGVTTNASVDGLTAVGVLSAEDVAYIREHQIAYHGFDLSNMAADVPVFTATFTNTKLPRRITAYSDGHVAMEELDKTR